MYYPIFSYQHNSACETHRKDDLDLRTFCYHKDVAPVQDIPPYEHRQKLYVA